MSNSNTRGTTSRTTSSNTINQPAAALCTVLSNPRTADAIDTAELSQSLNIHQRNFGPTYRGKRVQRVATANGWCTVKARRLRLPGNGQYLIRETYLATLYRKGITRKGCVWVGHKGSGKSAEVPPISEWLTVAWLQGVPAEVLAARVAAV